MASSADVDQHDPLFQIARAQQGTARGQDVDLFAERFVLGRFDGVFQVVQHAARPGDQVGLHFQLAAHPAQGIDDAAHPVHRVFHRRHGEDFLIEGDGHGAGPVAGFGEIGFADGPRPRTDGNLGGGPDTVQVGAGNVVGETGDVDVGVGFELPHGAGDAAAALAQIDEIPVLETFRFFLGETDDFQFARFRWSR